MKKGISPIVAVVLLIAIAVIAAVGLYFWVTAFAGGRYTSTTPATISAVCVGSTATANGTLFIYNTGTKATGTLAAATGTAVNSSVGVVDMGDTVKVTAADISATLYSGTRGTVYGNDTATATWICTETT